MYSWARFRAADLAVTLYWLHDRTQSPGSWTWRRRRLPRATTGRPSFVTSSSRPGPQGKFELDTHGVNTGMALKYGGVRYRLTGDADDKDAVFGMLDLLDRYHGQATGIFTCDEHLAGRSPSQGTELCTVVEAMYSLEVLASILGDSRLGDRLEKLAFNALPATFKKDMTAHQYDQQSNQVICSAAGEHVYVNNGRLEPLRPGAELRLLHGQHAPGLAQVCLPPLDEDRRRRSGGDRVCARASSRRRSRASRSRSPLRRLIRFATRSRSRSPSRR